MRRLAGALAGLLALAGSASAAPRFSDGFRPPPSKQGVHEYRMAMSADDLAARGRKLRSLGAAYIQYNLWWSQLESAGLPSSPTPLACPDGHLLVPGNEAERRRLGYHRFRCVDRAYLGLFDALIARDAAFGLQSGVTLWSSPPQYREPGCLGSPGAPGKQGCAPRDDALDDFEDYVNLVASRYAGGPAGKVSHFIVWNENASPVWFDATPRVARDDLSEQAVARRLDLYAEMVRRAHAALQRHQRRSLLYASTDQLWESRIVPGHLGSRRLLDGLWERLGTDYSWSVVVHPYGAADKPAPRGAYTFANLESVVAHQRARLAERGIDDPRAPQARLLASEQGWGLKEFGREGQARQICLAHARATAIPELVAVAHNYFHSIEPDEGAAGAASSQGAFLGLLPNSVPNSLAGMERTSTGRAFAATMNPRAFGRRADNYCCQAHGAGCPLPPR